MVSIRIPAKTWDSGCRIGDRITRFPLNNGFTSEMCFVINSHSNLTYNIIVAEDLMVFVPDKAKSMLLYPLFSVACLKPANGRLKMYDLGCGRRVKSKDSGEPVKPGFPLRSSIS